jgi:UDP-glucuronate 4-epimerase
MRVLVTGGAGFIGYSLVALLIKRGDDVLAIDNLNDYYDVELKHRRLAELGIDSRSLEYGGSGRSQHHENLRFFRIDLKDKDRLFSLFRDTGFDAVCNLAAQAGVRYSLTHPDVYVDTNIGGFLNLLEAIREHGTGHLVYASSSSVYGIDTIQPFIESRAADHPASLYAVSKRSNELMAHCYSHLYGYPSTGLRFFTVYGPWGRPDMALFLFTKAILEGKPIDVYNRGDMQRDFTYIDDIVSGIVRVIDCPAVPEPDWDGRSSGVSPAPARVYNIGHGSPVKLLDFIAALEDELGIKATKNLLPMQPGDVPATHADCSALERDFGYRPNTSIQEGIKAFVEWYRSYYGV